MAPRANARGNSGGGDGSDGVGGSGGRDDDDDEVVRSVSATRSVMAPITDT